LVKLTPLVFLFYSYKKQVFLKKAFLVAIKKTKQANKQTNKQTNKKDTSTVQYAN